MNLIDAVKSGRPFKRQKWGAAMWLSMRSFEEDGVIHTVPTAFPNPRGNEYIFSAEDILADDWEIQETEVRITRSQFWEAAHLFVAQDSSVTSEIRADRLNSLMRELAKRLGLEP